MKVWVVETHIHNLDWTYLDWTFPDVWVVHIASSRENAITFCKKSDDIEDDEFPWNFAIHCEEVDWYGTKTFSEADFTYLSNLGEEITDVKKFIKSWK